MLKLKTKLVLDTVVSGVTIGWTGGCYVASNNCVYYAPNTSSHILKYNVSTRAVSFILAATGYSSPVLAPNGFIYLIPIVGARQVRILNTATDAVSVIGASVTDSYQGGCLAPNGCIYCSSGNGNTILKIDASTNTVSTISGVLGSELEKYSGFVLARNGLLYSMPRQSQSVLKLDPSTNTFTQIPIAGLGTRNYFRTTLGFDGYIYCSPAENVTGVGRFDTVTETIANVGAPMPSGIGKHGQITPLLNGRMTSAGGGYFTSTFLIDSPSNFQLSATLTQSGGGVVLPNGDVLMTPVSGQTRMIRLISSYPKIYNFEGTIPANLADLPTSNYNVLHNRLT